MSNVKKNIGVLVSGRGSNLQALIDSSMKGDLPANIAVVISNKPEAFALERARNSGIPAILVNHKDFQTREAFEEQLIKELDRYNVELVILAGFMRVLTPLFIRRYHNRIINIHPALLPSFPGTHAQKQALDYGVKVSGVTVHFVDEGTDTGCIISQTAVPVLDDDTEETLSARILEEEHKIFPYAVKLVIEDRVEIVGRRVRIKF